MATTPAKATKATKTPAKARKTPAAPIASTAEPNHKSVSHDEIAHLAHRFWNERGRQHGQHQDDWLRAEQELRGKAS